MFNTGLKTRADQLEKWQKFKMNVKMQRGNWRQPDSKSAHVWRFRSLNIHTCLALRSNTTYCWHWSSLLFLIVQKWRTRFSLWSSSFKISEENILLATVASSIRINSASIVFSTQKENCSSPTINVSASNCHSWDKDYVQAELVSRTRSGFLLYFFLWSLAVVEGN